MHYLSLDLETYDPQLLTHGPGGARSDGYIIGVALAGEGWSEYLPIRHSSGNVSRVEALTRLSEALEHCDILLGANVNYDLEWLRADFGIVIPDSIQCIDLLLCAALIDEDRLSYTLDSISHSYLGYGKDESGLDLEAENRGWKAKEAKGRLRELPGDIVATYAKRDAELLYPLWEKMEPELDRQDLKKVLSLEMETSKVLLDMRFHGVPIDRGQAEKTSLLMLNKAKELQNKLDIFAGHDVDIWSFQCLARIADRFQWHYPKTEKGHPSFPKGFLSRDKAHPFWPLVLEARKWDRAGGTFVQDNILGFLCPDDRIRPSYRQVKGANGNKGDETGGTVSGRFACEKPNFQQIPGRDPEIKNLIRTLIVAPEGYRIVKLDYQAQEIRVALAYAKLLGIAGADGIIARYADPSFDIYRMIAALHYCIPDSEVSKDQRQRFKQVVLARMYGSGAKKISETLEVEVEEAQEIIEAIRHHFPLFEKLQQEVMTIVEDRARRAPDGVGWITTILGRKRHFGLWGPDKWGSKELPKGRDEAKRRYGKVRLWNLHKALNSLVQGTSADMTKAAMVRVRAEMGIAPILSVHDELVYLIKDEKEATMIKQIMETSVVLPMPIVAEMKIGATWS